MICAAAQGCHTKKQTITQEFTNSNHFLSSSVTERCTLTVIRPSVQLPDVLTSQVVGDVPRETLKIVYAHYHDSIVYDTVQVEEEISTATRTIKEPITPVHNFEFKLLIICIAFVSIYLIFGRFFGKK